MGEAKPSVSDLKRSQRAFPQEMFRGGDHAAVRTKLNNALRKGSIAMPRNAPCKDFTLPELSKIELMLFEHRSPDLFTSDLRAPRHSTIESLQKEIAAEADYVEKHPEVFQALRDGKCADIAMQWAHHIEEKSRAKLSDTKFPLLAEKGSAEHSPELIRNGHHGIVKKLVSKVTCQVGHAAKAVSRGTWEGFPAWPYEVIYNASGYGPYPFWAQQSAFSGSLTGPGTPIQTWWSAVLNAERLDHGMCSLEAMGYWSKDSACTHLMLGNSYAYVFDQEQTTCCISSTPGGACPLTTMQRDFYTVFNDAGTIENYQSECGHYSGPVKKYDMHLTQPSNFYFWYVTDMDGKPVEQGEGPCSMYDSSGDRNCQHGPKMLFHQYHPETFKEAILDADVFAVPDVCKSTTNDCSVWPTNFCGVPSTNIVV